AVDELEQVSLVAARKRHGGDRLLYGHQGLVYGGLLPPVHGGNLNPSRVAVQPTRRAPAERCGQKKSGLVAPQPAKRGVFGCIAAASHRRGGHNANLSKSAWSVAIDVPVHPDATHMPERADSTHGHESCSS